MKLRCQNCNHGAIGEGLPFKVYQFHGTVQDVSRGGLLTILVPKHASREPMLICCPSCGVSGGIDQFEIVK